MTEFSVAKTKPILQIHKETLCLIFSAVQVGSHI